MPRRGRHFASSEEYLAYLQLYGHQAGANSDGFRLMSFCGVEPSSTRPDIGGRKDVVGDDVAMSNLGNVLPRVNVTADRISFPRIPAWLWTATVYMPQRMLDRVCASAATTGKINRLYEFQIFDSPEEEQWPETPAAAPPGVDPRDWLKLNPAEKRLLWDYYNTQLILTGRPELASIKTGAYVARLAYIRQKALDWALEQRPYDEPDDTRRNALQHGYWQCLLTKEFGEAIAREWGDAHEKFAEPSTYGSARMDLYNNKVGRMIGNNELSCELGVSWWDMDPPERPTPFRWTPIPLSEGTGPGGGNPPPPPPPPPLPDM